jgi:uncharacterized OB-fold protein
MSDRPYLQITDAGDSEPMASRCSACGRVFLFPEDRNPEDAAAEVVAAFEEHVGEAHAEEAKD